MTYRQKTIVGLWISILVAVVGLFLFDEWVMENWHSMKWPLLVVIALIAGLSNTRADVSLEQGRRNINDIVSDHPWIKLYMAGYCSVVAVVCVVCVSRGVNISEHLGAAELLMAILGIMLPVYVVQQLRTYKDAGKNA